MEDFLDIIDTLLAADTYESAGRFGERSARLVANAGAGAFAKGSSVLSWGVRGVDALVDEIGIDLEPGVRAQLKAEVEQAKAGFFANDLLPPAEEEGRVLNAAARVTEGGSSARDPDRVRTNHYDP